MKSSTAKRIDIGFSIHRPEMVPAIMEAMKSHDCIYLKEPSVLGFNRMLKNEISVEDFLMKTDSEYPEFSRQMYNRLKKIHKRGKRIFQLEPYFNELLNIHQFFGQGHTPDEIKKTLSNTGYMLPSVRPLGHF